VKTSIWAKIFGWGQFGIALGGQVFGGGALPHNWRDWTTLLASLGVAAATHHASNTDGTR
jgi:hypothetical protein